MVEAPYYAALRDSVEAAYAAAPDRVSPGLEVCDCPVCMTEEVRRKIIDKPCRALESWLIAEYTNSAHGVPSNLDDLAALLPRYLDLMAKGEATDALGIGVELSRFGGAVAVSKGAFPPPGLRAAYLDWADLMLLHGGWLRATDGPKGGVGEDRLSPFYLFQAIAAGGVPVDVVTGALESLFADPEVGQAAKIHFFAELGKTWERRGFDLYALKYIDEDGRAALVDWLQRWLSSWELEELLTEPGVTGPPFWAEQVQVAISNREALTARSIAEEE
uniref:hypothetical protein n=1 Tax=Roseovarius indicus TaxID=540747 RepID=UPI003B515645